MGAVFSIEEAIVTYQRVNNIKDQKSILVEIIDPEELPGDDAANKLIFSSDGYLADLQSQIKSNSQLFFPILLNIDEVSYISVTWIHIPNNTTNQQFYDFCDNNGYFISSFQTITLFDFGGCENPKLLILLYSGIAFLLAGLITLNKNDKKQQFINVFNLVLLFCILSFIIIWGIQSNHIPQNYAILNEIQNREIIPLNENQANEVINTNTLNTRIHSRSQFAIPAKSHQDFVQKVLKLIKNKNAIPWKALKENVQATYTNGTSMSSKIYDDEKYTIEFSSLAPNSEISPHTHSVDVVVICLTDGFIGTLNGESKAISKLLPVLIKSGESHSFLSDSKGGYLVSIHASTTQSLFIDIP
jgi:quercetin dioxygenase-like cupin family protein